MKIKFGTRWEQTFIARGVLEVYPEWRDLWIGSYMGPDAVYVCRETGTWVPDVEGES